MMKIICKENCAKNINLKEVTIITHNDFNFNLQIGKEYIVMGIAINKDTNCLYYLTDHNGLPNWYPYMLFDVSDNVLNSDWNFKLINKEVSSEVFAIWGFKELCNTEGFYDNLMDRGSYEMETYFKRKMDTKKLSD